ncbi:MAG: hypothetical protein CHACPFDD_01463 [Phycisphaerae bacterium]|nr:hypothetical protein [Phycisphaerae bacterium]
MALLSRSAFNFLVDLVLLLSFVALLLSAGIIAFVFPPATRADGWSLWRLGFDHWMLVHLVSLGVFALLILLHVILHWTWAVSFVVSRVNRYRSTRVPMPPDGIRTIYGVTLLIAVLIALGAVLSVATFMVRRRAG